MELPDTHSEDFQKLHCSSDREEYVLGARKFMECALMQSHCPARTRARCKAFVQMRSHLVNELWHV